MPDFSDKYKRALEYQEISPDFKERTAKAMTELLDSENTDSLSAQPYKRKIKMTGMLSAMGAAAACFAVVVALNNAGVFDRDFAPAVSETDIIVTEETDMPEAFESVTEAVMTVPETAAEVIETKAAAVTTTFAAEETDFEEIIAEEKAADNYGYAETAQTTAVTAEKKADPEPIPQTANAPAVETHSAVQSETAVTIVSESTDGGESFSLETVLILEPYVDEAEVFEEMAEEEIAAETEDEYEEAVEEAAGVPDPSAFSLRRASSDFSAQNSSAVITPLFEDISAEDGTVISYEPKSITSVTDLLKLGDGLYAFSAEAEPDVTTEAPADSRFIIDYADRQGNVMRIYTGNRYICFAYEGGYYTYELTEKEYNELDSFLFSVLTE